MFEDAIKDIAYECKEWTEVSDDDRMYLYRLYGRTSYGIEVIMDAVIDSGNSFKDLITILLDVPCNFDDDIQQDLQESVFELMDDCINRHMELLFNQALAEVEFELVNSCGSMYI